MRGIKMIENDYELVYLAQENNEIAQEYLINKYKYIINVIINKKLARITALKIERDDIFNIGLLALHQAINTFNSNDSSFASFATILINRRINNYFKINNRKKDSVYINSISLNDETFNKSILKEKVINPDAVVIKEENHQELAQKIYYQLTDLEKSIFKLIGDFDIQEISKILNVDVKKVYNAITRIRNKTSKVLELNSKFP